MGRNLGSFPQAMHRVIPGGQNEALVLESRTEEIAIAPNQTAPTDRLEIVEGQVEGCRDQRQVAGPYSCAAVRQVGNVAATRAGLPLEEQERASFGAVPADR